MQTERFCGNGTFCRKKKSTQSPTQQIIKSKTASPHNSLVPYNPFPSHQTMHSKSMIINNPRKTPLKNNVFSVCIYVQSSRAQVLWHQGHFQHTSFERRGTGLLFATGTKIQHCCIRSAISPSCTLPGMDRWSFTKGSASSFTSKTIMVKFSINLKPSNMSIECCFFLQKQLKYKTPNRRNTPFKTYLRFLKGSPVFQSEMVNENNLLCKLCAHSFATFVFNAFKSPLGAESAACTSGHPVSQSDKHKVTKWLFSVFLNKTHPVKQKPPGSFNPLWDGFSMDPLWCSWLEQNNL